MTQNHSSSKENNYVFEHFFELSPDLLCIAGFDGYFKKINPAVADLLGYTNEELFARPISDFIYGDDKNTTAKARMELTKNSPLLHFENRYLTKSGDIVWLSWTSMPIDKDEVVYAIAKNITHTKKLEEERNFLLTNYTKANEELKKLSLKSSHDLRSPVDNMLTIFNLLDTSTIKDQETLLFIDTLKSCSENLKQTLNDYLDKIIVKELSEIVKEEVNLSDSLQNVLRSIDSLINNSGTTIEINFTDIEYISFKKFNLESVFLNLLTNAIKYSKPGTLPIINISSKIEDGVKKLVFADNGLGFDMNIVKDKIFGLHQKFHNHIDSKGVGLYLVHNHITSLGGKITVESKVNEGTTFTISFEN